MKLFELFFGSKFEAKPRLGNGKCLHVLKHVGGV